MSQSVVISRGVSASYGWWWIAKGFGLFRKSPIMWLAMFGCYFLLGMASSIIPIIGPITLNLLAPVFIAGFMFGCRALEQGQPLEIKYLFAGFKSHTAQLITVGGLYFSGILLIVGIMFVSLDPSVMHALMANEKLTDAQAQALVGSNFKLSVLWALLLAAPLMMAYWFAPILVAFHGLTAFQALKQSFLASLKNITPSLVYGIVAFILLVVAMIPFGLGLLVMIPTMMATLYTSYRDIFTEAAGEEISISE